MNKHNEELIDTPDNEISVANANVVAEPTATVNGVVWLDSERIEYTRVDLANNKLSGLIRGTKGTTIQNWYSSNTVIVQFYADALLLARRLVQKSYSGSSTEAVVVVIQ